MPTTPGKMQSFGMRTSSKINSLVTLARRLIFLWMTRASKPLAVGRHQKTADDAVELRPNQRDVREVAVGDPPLGAVEHVVRAVVFGVGDHAVAGSSPNLARSNQSSR